MNKISSTSSFQSANAPDRSWFISLGDPASDAIVGKKFANLSVVAEAVPVPAAICVTVAAFAEALGSQRLQFLSRFFADLQATVGAFLLSSMTELQATLQTVTLPAALRTALHAELVAHFGALDGRVFAVRSSGTSEDSHSASFAGVYRSSLDAVGFDGICAALLDCWRAYYSYPAILMRLRANQFSPDPGMAVIIQELVPAQLAGVAFTTGSGPEHVLVEYVHGLGDALVSGTAVPATYRRDDGQSRADAEQIALAEVADTSARLRTLFGHDVDVEWAWSSSGLSILQVRPVTAGLRKPQPSLEPYVGTARLYLDDSLPPGMELGDCHEVYAGYVSKRARMYRRASQSGVATGAASLVSFNGSGLLAHADALNQLLRSTPAESVVLDLSSNIRQIILKKDQVYAYLVEVFGLTATATERHTVIIRDYLQGQYGFISTPLGATGLLLEYSPDGLMDMNRGIAECFRITVPENNAQPVFEETQAAPIREAWSAILPTVGEFTHRLNQELPGCLLEWVLEAGTPYFVDYSIENSNPPSVQHGASVTISPGTARGPSLALGDDPSLSRLSVGPAISVNKAQDVAALEPFKDLLNQVVTQPHKPIVFARQPYAALAVLFDHVAGFIFERGSLLCHLAILLREAGIPAVIAPDIAPTTGDDVLIANGCVTRLVPTSVEDSGDRV